jgi:two-component system phosphate regulon sensor histidine kinase PhoR
VDIYWFTALPGDLSLPAKLTSADGGFKWISREEADEVSMGHAFHPEFWNKLEEHSGDSAKELKDSLAKLEKQNQELKDTKEAMRVLLDDSKKLDDELKAERDRVQLILSSMGEGLLAIDTNKKLVLINPMAEQLLEVKSEDVIGKRWSEVVTTLKESKETPTVERSFSLVLRTRKVIMTSLKDNHFYQTKSGRVFPITSITAPLVSENELIGAVKVFRDITNEREIDAMKTEFISLASHQLRTPLSTIKWYTEMLLSGDAGDLTEDQVGYLKEVYRGNQRMVELVNALLNVSRIELGTFAVDPEEVDLVSVAKAALKDQKPQILKKELRVEENYAEGIPKIKADAKLTMIIYQNLIGNAVKYTPKGGRVIVGIAVDGSNILTTITDTGFGIPEAQQEGIFTKLYRADNAKERDPDGSGLGLYIVKSILDSVGGKVWFKSAENRGTSFYVTLPVSGMKPKKGSKPLETKSTKGGETNEQAKTS